MLAYVLSAIGGAIVITTLFWALGFLRWPKSAFETEVVPVNALPRDDEVLVLEEVDGRAIKVLARGTTVFTFLDEAGWAQLQAAKALAAKGSVFVLPLDIIMKKRK